jgi:hypothetical protein
MSWCPSKMVKNEKLSKEQKFAFISGDTFVNPFLDINLNEMKVQIST